VKVTEIVAELYVDVDAEFITTTHEPVANMVSTPVDEFTEHALLEVE
jgi:hypothetical protein